MGKATGEKKKLQLCCNSSFILAGRIETDGKQDSIVKARFIGNQLVRQVSNFDSTAIHIFDFFFFCSIQYMTII